MAEEQINLDETRRALARDRQRLQAMLTNLGAGLTPQQVMAEVVGTVMPYLSDLADVAAHQDETLAWASDQIEEHDDVLHGGDQSQLLPEDADKFRRFISAVKETSSASLANVTPGSAEAHGLQALIAGADELLAMVADFEMSPEEPPAGIQELEPVN